MALLIAAASPVIIFLYFINKKDTEKEPPRLLLKCFVWGCVSVVPIIIIEMFVSGFNAFDSFFLTSFFDAFAVAAAVEEGFKFLFLFMIVWKLREFDQYFDGIVYAVFVSLGFALIENIMYIFTFGFGAAILRAVLSVPAHGLFGVMMGYFFSHAKFSGKNRLLWLSYLVPVLFHGLFNFLLTYIGESKNGLLMLIFFAGFVALLVVLWRFGIRNIRKHYARDVEINERFS
jgi:RsiW-degrading membrane proteinase PrsW (M82 family)